MPEELEPDLVQRLLEKELVDASPAGRALPRRAVQTQRSVESYLQAGTRPRWMERLMEIESGVRRERRRLAAAHAGIAAEHARDPEGFAARWTAYAELQRFDDLNELIRQHNAWYPMERDLPMDLRTRDYVEVGGRSYRREELDAAWVLERFPPVLPPEAGRRRSQGAAPPAGA